MVFKENGYDDPKRDTEHNVAHLLRCQLRLRSYKKDDPKEVQQKSLPVCILRLILSSKSTELCQAMGEVAGAAHFWVMRSCKYVKVHKAEQRQTKQLCIRYIAFNKDGITLTHDSSSLHLADCVWSRSNDRKNDRKADTITQWKTSNELPCPVKIWASIIVRIMSYKGANNKSPGYRTPPVNMALKKNTIYVWHHFIVAYPPTRFLSVAVVPTAG